jgi:multidrug efflux pump subunit AcrA (membrane-fusion protein)
MVHLSPRFRRDLVAAATEADNVAFVDVQDPGTGTNFRFYDFEYQLALQLDGRSLDDVVSWASATYGLDLTPDSITEFAGRLAELGFLERGAEEPRPWSAPAGTAPSAPGAAPSQALEGPGAEWMVVPGAHTPSAAPPATIARAGTPDLAHAPGGLGLGGASPSDSPKTPPPFAATPVVATPSAPVSPPAARPVSAPTMLGFAIAPDRSKGAARKGTEPSAVTELPSDAFMEVPDSGPSSDRGASVSLGSSHATEPPRGLPERRQPPLPEAVVMTPFQDDVSRGRFTAPPPDRASRRGKALVFALIVLAGAGGGYYYNWTRQHPSAPQPVKVHVVSPQPITVFRWYSTSGSVMEVEARPLAFEISGRIAEVRPVGTTFTAGEVLGKLQGVSALEADLGKQRSRLAAYTQARDSAKAAGRQSDLREAESKVRDKQKQVDETQATLNKLLLRAPEAGRVVELIAKAGATVNAKAPVVKWKGRVLNGDFTMDEEDFTQANNLDFCKVEVSGPAPAAVAHPAGDQAVAGDAGAAGNKDNVRLAECKLPPPPPTVSNARTGSPLHKFMVGLPSDIGLVAGQPLRLARLRYEGVFPLPQSAIVRGPAGDKVWIATAAGTAQLRPVTVAESRDDALVSQGLSAEDRVILDPPGDLQEGGRLIVTGP